ncbi:hypothetical protein LBMAG49_28300 [Planctomycetota bacterium]|nr:hypothetical protein LBMAG49_28300 [Planctomycetota bacterium]
MSLAILADAELPEGSMPKKVLLAVLVLVALAAGAALLLRGGGAVRPDASPAQSSTIEPAARVTAAAADGLAQDPALGIVPPNSVRTASPVAPSANLVSVKIRGRIVDQKFAPRAGVELQLASWGTDASLMLSLSETAGKATDETCRTALDGSFSLPLAAGRRGELRVVAAAFVFECGQVMVASNADKDLGDLVTFTASRVSGVVRNAAGALVADVKITADTDLFSFRTQSQSTSGLDGSFTIEGLKSGTWHLRTVSELFLPASVDVEIAVEEHKTGISLLVVRGKAIAGQVLDERLVPVAGFKVGSNRKEARGAMSVQRFSQAEATTTDGGGYFTLANLEGETVSVRAFGKGYTSASEAAVVVGTGNLVLRVRRVGSIAGVLRDGAGKPIAGSSVSVAEVGVGGSGLILDAEGVPMMLDNGAANSRTAEDGTFRLDSVHPGNVIVRAEGKSHRQAVSQPIVLLPAQVIEGVVIVAAAGGTARVHVADASGKPVIEASVVIKRSMPPASEDPRQGKMMTRALSVRTHGNAAAGDRHFVGDDEQIGSGVTDADGNVEIKALPASAAVIVASHASFAESLPVSIQLPAAGVVEARVVLREPGFADVLVTDVSGNPCAASLSLHGPLGGLGEEREQSGESAADGKMLLGPLVTGDYWVELMLKAEPRHMGGATMIFNGDWRSLRATRVAFHVDSGKTTAVAVMLPLLAKVHGTVRGAEGPVAGVEVEFEQDGGDEPIDGLPHFGGGANAQTAADGSYAIERLEAGRYRVRFGKQGQLVKCGEVLDVPHNTVDVEKDLTLRFGTLRLQVVDKLLQNGIVGAQIELAEQSSPVTLPSGAIQRTRRTQVMSIAISTSSDDGGGGDVQMMTMGSQNAHAGIDGMVEMSDVPPGFYTVRIKGDGFAVRELIDQVITENAVTDCGRVALEVAGRIRGRVLDEDGNLVKMAIVRCTPSGAMQEPLRQPAVGGVFTFQSLVAGKYSLTAEGIGPSEGKSSNAVTVDLAPSQKFDQVELRLLPR